MINTKTNYPITLLYPTHWETISIAMSHYITIETQIQEEHYV